MTLASSSRIALAPALLFVVAAVPPIIAKEKQRTRHRKAPASVEKTKGQPCWTALRALSFPRSYSLRRDGSRDCVFSGAGVLQPAIGGAGGLAGARPFNALHLPGAACNLILILACLKCAIFHRAGGLVGVENLVAAVKRFHEHARDFTVVS